MIGVSACLGGCPVRYDGRDQTVEAIQVLLQKNQAIAVCPEVLGGLPIPRDPAEIVGGDGFAVWQGRAKVVTNQQEDVTEAFKQGAIRAYQELKRQQIETLILKEKSPSCGSQWIYDGTFSGTKKQGVGVATAYFLNQGIKVYSETQWLQEEG
ncbi:2-thiouracil desulfurase family protein [Enterococcus sp. LJL98]